MQKKTRAINKKLLIATGLYPPDIGGPATYVKMLEEHLSVYDIEFEIVAFTHVRNLPKVVRHMVFAWRLWRHAKDIDALYALDPISVGLPALLVSRLTCTPFLIRLGGDYAWEQGQQRFGLKMLLDEYTANKKSAPIPVRMLAWVQAFVVTKAQKVIVPSNYMKGIVSTWGVSDAQLEVIYSALFPLNVSESREQLRVQYGYTGTVLFSAARLIPWKGYDVLIDAVYSLRKQFSDVSLIIAGDGPKEAHLQKKVKYLNAESYIYFTGRLSKDELGKALKASDIFVLNTAYEGLSHQLLEVMDMGVPVVTTSVGGNPELIEDGISGLTVPYNDAEALEKAITRMIQSDDLRNRMIAQARARTQDFNQDRVVQEFVTMLEKTIWQKS